MLLEKNIVNNNNYGALAWGYILSNHLDLAWNCIEKAVINTIFHQPNGGNLSLIRHFIRACTPQDKETYRSKLLNILVKNTGDASLERFKIYLELGAMQEAECMMNSLSADPDERRSYILSSSLLVKKYRALGQEQKVNDLLAALKIADQITITMWETTIDKLYLYYYFPLEEIELYGLSRDKIKEDLLKAEHALTIKPDAVFEPSQWDMLIKCWIKFDLPHALDLLKQSSSLKSKAISQSMSLSKLFSLSKEAD